MFTPQRALSALGFVFALFTAANKLGLDAPTAIKVVKTFIKIFGKSTSSIVNSVAPGAVESVSSAADSSNSEDNSLLKELIRSIVGKF